MNRGQKEELVAGLRETIAGSEAAFLVNYRGINVGDMQGLRGDLRESGAIFKVAKTRLMVRALEDIDGGDQIKEDCKDQIGFVFAQKDTPAVAKILVEFAKKRESSEFLVSSLFESRALSKADIAVLASLPSREVLLGQLAQVLQAPMTNMARSLSEIVASFARALNRVAEQKA
jgi:large subunit ribosomal protein L10